MRPSHRVRPASPTGMLVLAMMIGCASQPRPAASVPASTDSQSAKLHLMKADGEALLVPLAGPEADGAAIAIARRVQAIDRSLNSARPTEVSVDDWEAAKSVARAMRDSAVENLDLAFRVAAQTAAGGLDPYLMGRADSEVQLTKQVLGPEAGAQPLVKFEANSIRHTPPPALEAAMREVVKTKEPLAPNPDVPLGSPQDLALSHTLVNVLYATDRAPTSTVKPKVAFGSGRGPLVFGRATVGIPRDHRLANLESPVWYKFEFSINPAKHVALIGAEILSGKEEFVARAKSQVERGERAELMVFVHGFDTSFEDAVRRTGQLAYDLGVSGTAVCFSWPSVKSVSVTGYMTDMNNADWAGGDLARVLRVLSDQSGAKRIYVIAHSMGNRVLSKGVAVLAQAPRAAPLRLTHAILAAPDVDADTFRKDTAGVLNTTAGRVSLYACSKDLALEAARKLQGGYPRAGESANGVLVALPMDTMDASKVDTSLIGHSYYGDNTAIVSDIYHIVHNDLPPKDRRLIPVPNAGNPYWQFP